MGVYECHLTDMRMEISNAQQNMNSCSQLEKVGGRSRPSRSRSYSSGDGNREVSIITPTEPSDSGSFSLCIWLGRGDDVKLGVKDFRTSLVHETNGVSVWAQST